MSVAASATRWVDVPFTRDESLQADKKFKITCEFFFCVCVGGIKCEAVYVDLQFFCFICLLLVI